MMVNLYKIPIGKEISRELRLEEPYSIFFCIQESADFLNEHFIKLSFDSEYATCGNKGAATLQLNASNLDVISQLISYWLQDHQLIPVHVQYGYTKKYNKNDDFTEMTTKRVDGVHVVAEKFSGVFEECDMDFTNTFYIYAAPCERYEYEIAQEFLSELNLVKGEIGMGNFQYFIDVE